MINNGDKFEIEVSFYTREKVVARVVKSDDPPRIKLALDEKKSNFVYRYRSDLKVRLPKDMPTGTITYMGDPEEVVAKRRLVMRGNI